MLTLHHLNNSRSQRVLWLLEELDMDYEIKFYQRDAATNMAPPELEAVHPLGKAPVLTDNDNTIIESGAIIDYILRHHGGGRLIPRPETPEHEQYLQWLHYAEGSVMLPLMLRMYTGRLPDGGAALQPRINEELNRHLGYMERALDGVDWFVGNALSGADIQLSFAIEVAPLLHSLETFPNLAAMRNRIHARPAYQRALLRGGKYDFGPPGQQG
jgi:glutathione S-transferase